MKIYTRLIIHFVSTLFLFFLFFVLMYILLLFSFSYLSDTFIWFKRLDYSMVKAVYVVFIALIFCLWYGWYAGAPLFHLLEWLKQLASGTYEEPKLKERFYKRTKIRKLHRSYQVYDELILHMRRLTSKLNQNEIARIELEEMRKDWIAGVSHDMKTPLSYIKGYTAMMLSPDYAWTEEEKEKFIRIIQEKALYIEQLIEDFQISQSTPTLSAKKQDIVEFIRCTVIDIANNPQAQHYQFSFHAEVHRIYTCFDEKLMLRIFYNLLMNTIIHNPMGTKIHTNVELKEQVLITISDNGIGINQKNVQHLFDRYYRGTSTDTPEAGTGLGMFIVQQLISAHGGTIEVKSIKGKGTTFLIYFPIQS